MFQVLSIITSIFIIFLTYNSWCFWFNLGILIINILSIIPIKYGKIESDNYLVCLRILSSLNILFIFCCVYYSYVDFSYYSLIPVVFSLLLIIIINIWYKNIWTIIKKQLKLPPQTSMLTNISCI